MLWLTEFGTRVLEIYIAYPLLGALIALIIIDIVTGTLVAVGDRTLNSTTSFKGMTRKAMVLLILGTGAVLEPYTGLPLAKLIAGFYICTEALSITENVHRAGVPLPKFLTDTLQKLKNTSESTSDNKGRTPNG